MREIVKNDPKGRYEINDGKIRARYGHSYPVSLNHKEDTKSSSSPWNTEEKPIIHP